jgi:hypothetical protein
MEELMENTTNLDALKRFTMLDESFTLTKIESHKTNSLVSLGRSITGIFDLKSFENETKHIAFVSSMGFDYIKTSQIIKVLNFDENSTTFQTLGGVYLLEKSKNDT